VGVLGFIESGAATFGSFFAGYLFDIAGHYNSAFWMGIAISVMGIVFSMMLRPMVGMEQTK